MTTSLEDDIRRTFDRLAEQTTISPEPRFRQGPIVSVQPTSRTSTRRILVPALALAAALLLVVGGIVISRPETKHSGEPVAPTPTENPPAVGLFPPGDTAAVIAAGFSTPEAAVEAYLADRTRPEAMPVDVQASYSLSDVDRVDDNTAVVWFNVQTEGESADGLLLTRQVAAGGDAERWVVVDGGVATLTIDQLDYRDGRLSGTFSNDIGGPTAVDVYDAVSGEKLATATSSPFTIEGLSSPAVSVRFWHTQADEGHALAVFAEALVHDGETVSDRGFAALYDSYAGPDNEPTVPFATGGVSTFDNMEPGEVITVVDDGEIKIEARHGDGDRPYCVDLIFRSQATGPACFSTDDIAYQRMFFNAAAGDVASYLVGGIVPDDVTEIRSEHGDVITPVANVWWAAIDTGDRVTFTIVTADGRTMETTLG